MRREGWSIWVTDLGQKAHCLSLDTDVHELPDKLALVMGSEASGATQEMLESADRRCVQGVLRIQHVYPHLTSSSSLSHLLASSPPPPPPGYTSRFMDLPILSISPSLPP
jgi:hypothetical protein